MTVIHQERVCGRTQGLFVDLPDRHPYGNITERVKYTRFKFRAWSLVRKKFVSHQTIHPGTMGPMFKGWQWEGIRKVAGNIRSKDTQGTGVPETKKRKYLNWLPLWRQNQLLGMLLWDEQCWCHWWFLKKLLLWSEESKRINGAGLKGGSCEEC